MILLLWNTFEITYGISFFFPLNWTLWYEGLSNYIPTDTLGALNNLWALKLLLSTFKMACTILWLGPIHLNTELLTNRFFNKFTEYQRVEQKVYHVNISSFIRLYLKIWSGSLFFLFFDNEKNWISYIN